MLPTASKFPSCVQATQSQCGFTRELRLPLMNMYDEAGWILLLPLEFS